MNRSSIKTARTVSEFIKIIEKIKNLNLFMNRKEDLIFRGQVADYPLLPKIARAGIAGGKLINLEMLAMDEFKRLSLPFLKGEFRDDWDSTALAQHHGLPTRFLDWTYSALTALWFCVCKDPEIKYGKRNYGVVWVIKTNKSDFQLNDEGPLFVTDTYIIRPRLVASRIQSQMSLFTCHPLPDRGKIVPMERCERYKNRMEKIIVPYNRFLDIRKKLMACGVNQFSIFPDLDGLSKYINERYFMAGEIADIKLNFSSRAK